MAILIEITKIKVEDDIHFYNVESLQFDCPKSLVVGLDAKNKKIYYLLNNDLEKPVYILDLFNLPESFKNNFLDSGLVLRVFKKAKQAMDKNEYPQYLDYAA